jgi:pimeloyl-ACP methyl ester carboxylesterase
MGDERKINSRLRTRRGRKIMMVIAGAFLLCVLVLAGLLFAWSPGRPRPFTDSSGRTVSGSVSEKLHLEINGVQQGMFIKSRDPSNPVLLYLHGGLPDYFLTESYPTGLEDQFTVCWWELRGSGLSYRAEAEPGAITAEQLVSDTLEVTRYLRDRFGKDRIFLMGHSGGSFIAIQAAAQAPQLYQAYIGVAQMSNQLKSEWRAYQFMLSIFRQNGNSRMVRKLESAPVTMDEGTPAAYLAVRDVAMHSLGIGTTHDIRSVLTGIFLASLRFPEYTVGEKLNLWRAKASSGVSSLWDTMITTDLSREVPELAIPVYFLEGVYDYTCSYAEARSYFESLKAPVKGFYTFENSAHSPIFEEPARVERILREDVLAGTNGLADRM